MAKENFLKGQKGQIARWFLIVLGIFTILAVAILGNWGSMDVKVVDVELSNPSFLGDTCTCTVTLLNKGASGYVKVRATLLENKKMIDYQDKITEISKWRDTKKVEFKFPCERGHSYTAQANVLETSKK
jgi:hypothetical protein